MKIDLNVIRKEIKKDLENISKTPKKASEAEDLSNGFLLAKSYLADCLEVIEKQSGSLKAVEKATFSQAVLNVPKGEKGKELPVSAKEHIANVDKEYLKVHDERIATEAAFRWISTHIEIFSDAVVTFRKKGERLSK